MCHSNFVLFLHTCHFIPVLFQYATNGTHAGLRYLKELARLILSVGSESGRVFLEEPGNGEVFMPVNSSQTLSC